MREIFNSNNMTYLPKPHTMKVFRTNKIECTNITSVFCFVLNQDGDILVFEHSSDKTRMVDLPGGHIENNETPIESVKREVLEETGYSIKDIEVMGFKEINLTGKKPEGYKYPYPKSSMIFFKAKIKTKETEELFEDSDSSFFMTKKDLYEKLSPDNACFLDFF